MRRICWSVAFLMLSAAGLHAQTVTTTVGGRNSPQASALPAPDAIQGGLVTLRGNTRPEANAKNDRGRVSDDMILNHMMLQLRRSPAREQALQQFINDIHDRTSPFFHHWITATEFGQRYGVAPADVARVTDWLESQGFKVNLVYPNQMVIDFTGSAGQIRQAFHTEIHHLLVNGQAHIANMSDPQIPAELASTVAGVVSLNDFRPQPMIRRRANYTIASGEYGVVPADLWTIYHFNPAFAAGYSGQGQTIVVVEDSDLYTTQDWSDYRSAFGLASAYPLGSLTQVHPGNCTDPGTIASDDEATLDVEVASAGAPSATIEEASCADTETTPGNFIALSNLINGGTPPAIISSSQGISESLIGAAFNASVNSVYQQAVTEGVSVFVSSGDSGAASTDRSVGDQYYAQYGISVSGFTSTPYNVSVGGTDYADSYQGTNATYWSATNAANYGSALSYIPEIPWNDSCASVLFGDYFGVLPTYGSGGLCNEAEYDLVNGTGNYAQYFNVSAGSGGPSGCATGAPDFPGAVSGTCAGYPKPSWQSGFVGNPSDGVRDTPDVSLFASDGSWGHAYTICFSDPSNGGVSCSGTPDTWNLVGGTSAAAPVWAAIQSLVNQASGSRWGNPDSEYYSRAATEYGAGGSTSCSSNLGNTVASNCIFYDVTQIPLIHGGSGTGGDIDVPCYGMNCYVPSGIYGVLSAAPQTLDGAWVTNLGSGYTSAPSCTLSGGGGSGATCEAITTGVVTSVGLVNGGAGYTSQPTCTLTGGGGTDAACVATISPEGAVNGVFLYTFGYGFGSGYSSAPTCTISGGGGTGATCTATEGPGIYVGLTSPGDGYTTLPRCVLSGGGGTGGTCADWAVNTSDNYQPAFGAGTGWDFATGIGTVNVSNLVASFIPSSAPSVSFSASSLSYGNQPTSTTSSAQTETVTNTGTANLTISTVTISGTNASDFAKSADTCTGATVTPSNTCSVSVTFTPSATGSRSASLNFTDNASNSPQTVSLRGTGTGPVVSLSAPPTFPSEPIGTTSPSQTVTLTNTGSASLTFTAIGVTGPFATVASGTTCSTANPVGASGSCTVAVAFMPTAAGKASGSLSFSDNAPGTPQTIALSGTGQDFTLAAGSGSPTSATVAPGSTASYTLSVGGEGAFNQSVSFTCTGAPSEATCTVSPSPVTPGSSATNITVSVTTTAPSLGAPRSRPLPPVPPLLPGLRGLLILAWVLMATAWAIGRRNIPGESRWRFTMVSLASGLLLALALAGCGGGGSSVTHNPGTPAGNYTLTVTGSAGSGSSALSHTMTLTLNVS